MKDEEIDIFNFGIKLLILNTFSGCRAKPITAADRMETAVYGSSVSHKIQMRRNSSFEVYNLLGGRRKRKKGSWSKAEDVFNVLKGLRRVET